MQPRSRTFAWLAKESLRRRSLLLDELSSKETSVRLRTSDGALLLPMDPLGFVVGPLLQQSGSAPVEFLAEVVGTVPETYPSKYPKGTAPIVPSSQAKHAVKETQKRAGSFPSYFVIEV